MKLPMEKCCRGFDAFYQEWKKTHENNHCDTASDTHSHPTVPDPENKKRHKKN